ncbi:PfkB family carbohydrate kinase [Natrinema sp. SYSU A 869]|uniref:PfkB family carbohydrate kinase n=1 Tax=Natrinema sp. SYSU A 869 TaxID=2871694 RepID=UPI00272E23D2|nr:PfkB family carbohydrate kinase [Natrinema sp. SYSU A 869]
MLDLLRRAREANCSVYFDPNWRPELWDDDDTVVLEDAIKMADVLKATPDELKQLGYRQKLLDRRCEVVCRDGPHTVFLTRGDKGAMAYATADAPWGDGVVEHEESMSTWSTRQEQATRSSPQRSPRLHEGLAIWTEPSDLRTRLL